MSQAQASEFQKVVANSVACSISDGTATINFDIAADSKPYMAHGSHTINDYNSQVIKDKVLQATGSYDAVTLTVSFAGEVFEQVESWWKAGKRGLTYAVNGSNAGMIDKTYSDCTIRVSDTPSVVPDAEGYVTCTVEIQCLAVVKAEENNGEGE